MAHSHNGILYSHKSECFLFTEMERSCYVKKQGAEQ